MNLKTIVMVYLAITFFMCFLMRSGISKIICRLLCDCDCCKKGHHGRNVMPRSILKRRPEFVVFGSPRCGYTVKLLDEIKERGATNRFIYKDITKEENREEYESLGVQGVPVTVSMRDESKMVVGYRPFENLLAALE